MKVKKTNARTPILVSWSSGKDSAWALHILLQSKDVEVMGFFTTINRVHRRVAMHAVSDRLLRTQARAVGFPLQELEIPYPCSNTEYARVMERFLAEATTQGIKKIAFGDLSLEDVRRYREEKMRHTGIEPVFPIWGTPTNVLSRKLIEAGFRMLVTCIDPRSVPRKLIGREYDKTFLEELPKGADPCGENGEFHTFVFDGPIFTEPLQVQPGRIVVRDGFVFADVVEK
ncbi:MAG: adenine nucleotide alpha hydrolase [Deltaproteobacteria bacterium]|nr:MAG: adenine nucleotide alpha hydrolase [Deltaproteobacteria bacterium]